MRKWIAVITGVAVLVLVNFGIYQREQILRDGRIVLLELAPVDPRSLMQGDYMALNFAIANQAFTRSDEEEEVSDGHLVVALNEKGVGQFLRRAGSAPLAPGEVALRYRVRHGEPRFATNAFFFQEGQAQTFEQARYGEFRVAANGEMILTGMRDDDFRLLGTAR